MLHIFKSDSLFFRWIGKVAHDFLFDATINPPPVPHTKRTMHNRYIKPVTLVVFFVYWTCYDSRDFLNRSTIALSPFGCNTSCVYTNNSRVDMEIMVCFDKNGNAGVSNSALSIHQSCV